VRFLVAEHGRTSHDLLGGTRRLIPLAHVGEAVTCQIVPGQLQRSLDRGRPALVRPDVQEPSVTRASVPAGGHWFPPERKRRRAVGSRPTGRDGRSPTGESKATDGSCGRDGLPAGYRLVAPGILG